MNLSDADRRAVLVLLEQLRAILRGPVSAEAPMAGDVVEVAGSYPERHGVDPNGAIEVAERREMAPVAPGLGRFGEPDTDGGLAQQAAETASRGIYAGAWCRHGTRCPHPNVCQLAIGGCTERQERYRDLE